MKQLLILIASLFLALPACAEPATNQMPHKNIAQFPAAGRNGYILIAQDALNPSDCLVGGGTSRAICVLVSNTWFPLGAGSVGATSATQCVMLDASAINCDTTNGCTSTPTAGDNFDYTVATFISGADNFGSWSFNAPPNITGSTFVARVFWTSDNGACNNFDTNDDVCWTVASEGVANNEDWDGASVGTSEGIEDRCIAIGQALERSAER